MGGQDRLLGAENPAAPVTMAVPPALAGPAGAGASDAPGARGSAWVRPGAQLLPLVLLALTLAYLYVAAPAFFRPNNLVNILVQSSSLGLLALGMTFVMLTGGIDLSLPANMALAAVLGGMAVQAGGNVLLGCLVMVGVAILVGALNGFAVAGLHMTPFVVTLATMTMIGGATVWMTNSQSIAAFPESFFDLFMARPGGVPTPVWVLLVCTVAASMLASSTVYGRWLYAVGINARAAQVARVPVERVRFFAYVLSGAMAGVTAILLTARLGAASANMGNDGVVLDIVSACVVGGISIYGGAGRPLGAVLGAIFITVISNSLNQLGVSYFVNLVIKGVVIIGFIALENLVRRSR